MLAHLNAVKDALAPLGYATFIVWAFQPPGQYVVLSGKGWDDPAEMPLCNTSETLDTDIRIKAVTGTPEGVFTMLQKIRDTLSPGLKETRVTLSGRSVAVRYSRSEFVDVDQDTTITSTGRHPAFGVDTYRLTSDPA